jgi:endogenous inhibitor of DNA gyrase (YacG/DUF329 family)
MIPARGNTEGPQPFLAKIGLLVRLRLAVLGLIGLCVIDIFSTICAPRLSSGLWAVLGIGGLVVVVVMGWVLLTVRCPSCGTRIAWRAMREQKVGDWWPWLTSIVSCPACGSDGRGAPSSQR